VHILRLIDPRRESQDNDGFRRGVIFSAQPRPGRSALAIVPHLRLHRQRSGLGNLLNTDGQVVIMVAAKLDALKSTKATSIPPGVQQRVRSSAAMISDSPAACQPRCRGICRPGF